MLGLSLSSEESSPVDRDQPFWEDQKRCDHYQERHRLLIGDRLRPESADESPDQRIKRYPRERLEQDVCAEEDAQDSQNPDSGPLLLPKVDSQKDQDSPEGRHSYRTESRGQVCTNDDLT